MSPSTTTTQTLEQALSELPAKLRVHELAKRAGLTSKDVLAALSAAGVKASSAASSVSAVDATAVLTTLLGVDDPAPVAEPVVPDEQPAAEAAATDEPTGPDPGFFAAPLFLPPAEAKPARRRRAARAAAEPPTDEQPALPQATTEVAPSVLQGEIPADAPEAGDAAAETGTSRSGRRRRGRSGGRGRGGQSEDTMAELPTPADHTDEVAAVDPVRSVEADPALPSGVEPVPEADTDDEDGDQARRRRRRGRRGRGRAGDDQLETDESSAGTGVTVSSGDVLPAGDPSTSDDVPSGDAFSAEEFLPSGDTRSSADTLSAGEALPSGDTGPATGTVASPGDGSTGGADGRSSVEGESDDEAGDDESNEEGGTRRRRRRRRRSGSADPVSEDGKTEDDPDNTVVHVREPRPAREATSSSSSEVQGVRGSTRLEAKRQRRRDSRGDRKRPQILTEAEFLARREAVDRVMAVRQRGDLAQVALLEDGILVEHFVSRAGSESLMGNIYLGKVQNVLPSMEAAFLDIGKGRNAVLYAGEVNWDAAGLAGKARRIETALSGGDTILVQVSKDPVGQKGARLTTQISLPGRFLVYVPGGGATGISRKLPDTERKRLKSILDRIVPEDAGVIIRTAAEGVAEEELARDVERLKSQWEQISRQAEKKSNAPLLLSAEPDTLIKVVRDLFNSDISRLVLDGERAYEPVAAYIEKVAPELADRVSRYDGPNDVFSAYRIDEQIAKALERKVYLPSGGSLVIDRTEAMTVVDVNTGKYTGSGGNLEETVTKNNLEAAEEVVRQLRLRDIGGIIVVDFIDMVLESNRELVMRRLTECLGRDRTRHQVAEVTSLGLIQMTRKKMGTGLVEAFSEPCPHCQGRGILLHDVPMEDRSGNQEFEDPNRGRRRGKGRPESAPEPEPIVKPAPATVRPPDPRGPRPPGRATGEPAPEADPRPALVEPAQPVPDRARAADAGSNASFNAPRSRDASDAVSAVLAALDAQASRQAEPVASVDVRPADSEVGSAELAPSDAASAEPAPSGRRRGRRAAGRPAGAPTPPAEPSPPATSVEDASSEPAPVEIAVLAENESVENAVLAENDSVDNVVVDAHPADATVPDGVIDAEVVEQEVTSEALAHAASEFTATDLVVAPDVQVQVPQPEPVPVAPPEPPAPQATRPTRRRAGRPAGAAVASAQAPSSAATTVVTDKPLPTVAADNGSADRSSADHTSVDRSTANERSADESTAAESSATESTAAGSSAAESSADESSADESTDGIRGSAAAGSNGTTAAPVKAAPRRRRAASRPAGPAGAPVAQ